MPVSDVFPKEVFIYYLFNNSFNTSVPHLEDIGPEGMRSHTSLFLVSHFGDQNWRLRSRINSYGLFLWGFLSLTFALPTLYYRNDPTISPFMKVWMIKQEQDNTSSLEFPTGEIILIMVKLQSDIEQLYTVITQNNQGSYRILLMYQNVTVELEVKTV